MSERRNVLLIVVDQWRADFVPALGADFLRTPNLDRLCREGVTFRNHVTTAVPCGPARASLLTGLYLMNHRAVQNTVPLDARHFNLAKALRLIGYDPALIGYTTTTPDPRTSGPRDPRFLVLGDIMDGFRSVGAFEPNMDGYFGWIAQNGFELPPKREDIWLPEGVDSVPGATDKPSRIPAEFSDSSFFTERALTFLKGKQEKPWFLHLGYYRPHPPFVAPAPYHAMYKPEDMPRPVRADSPEAEAAQHPLLNFYIRNIRQGSFFHGAEGTGAALDEAQILQMRATYAGLITEIDTCLGRVFDHLEQTGQWDDTLIIFTSDHGEQLGDHHLLGKIGYHDESFRIPLVIKDPDAPERAGIIESAFTESVDVMPTILEWLGGEIPRAADGASLIPLVRGVTPAGWRDALHYEYDFRDVHYSRPETALGLSMDESSLCVIQDDDYKYVHFAALPPLFFDLRDDPHQFRNLADEPAYAGVVKDYAQKALSWRLKHAERTLTHHRATPRGLETRTPQTET
ncbi:phosphoric/sulfuric ester hydrolase PehA [Plastoroseomonas arctica]|uniref:Alkaline phosphatase family protein n=1 Tax=Plastoroseomonas arctica TaxID=1509237 RepID=A0AAF1K2J0_9PROT|nr:phosphoric/sulfuric ester hydrolase PehA [Plastoroseomonas arctica]MBR0655638.1 alkaline phosphatase family protein [Plastoroseomonas arctica]